MTIGELMNAAASAGARAVSLREAALRMPDRTTAERLSRDAALDVARTAREAADEADDVARAAQIVAYGRGAALLPGERAR